MPYLERFNSNRILFTDNIGQRVYSWFNFDDELNENAQNIIHCVHSVL